MDNALMVIFPYHYEDTWVFDDPGVDLVKEPFVFGIPEMIDDYEGNWYTINKDDEGWLCPALLKYFNGAPNEIYVKAESK